MIQIKSKEIFSIIFSINFDYEGWPDACFRNVPWGIGSMTYSIAHDNWAKSPDSVWESLVFVLECSCWSRLFIHCQKTHSFLLNLKLRLDSFGLVQNFRSSHSNCSELKKIAAFYSIQLLTLILVVVSLSSIKLDLCSVSHCFGSWWLIHLMAYSYPQGFLYFH
jgi:hypothetical protein